VLPQKGGDSESDIFLSTRRLTRGLAQEGAWALRRYGQIKGAGQCCRVHCRETGRSMLAESTHTQPDGDTSKTPYVR